MCALYKRVISKLLTKQRIFLHPNAALSNPDEKAFKDETVRRSNAAFRCRCSMRDVYDLLNLIGEERLSTDEL